jgi:hypothetical protein
MVCLFVKIGQNSQSVTLWEGTRRKIQKPPHPLPKSLLWIPVCPSGSASLSSWSTYLRSTSAIFVYTRVASAIHRVVPEPMHLFVFGTLGLVLERGFQWYVSISFWAVDHVQSMMVFMLPVPVHVHTVHGKGLVEIPAAEG